MTTFNDTIRTKYNTDNKTDKHKKVLLFLLLLIDIKDITDDDDLIHCSKSKPIYVFLLRTGKFVKSQFSH